jgi:carbamate kinase
MRSLIPLIQNGNHLVITHGNGFQVGNILVRVEEALGKAYAIPLDVCVAESQGELGYLIEQSLQNVLAAGRERASPGRTRSLPGRWATFLAGR